MIDDLENVSTEFKDRLAKSINLIANKCMDFYKKISIGDKFKQKQIQIKRKRNTESVSDSIIYADLLK